MLLKNKTAIITGCNRGIGKAILKEFAKNGANVFAHARKPSAEFESVLKELSQKYNVEITPLYFDMTDKDGMKEQVKNIIFKPKKRVDILINSAGVAHGGFFPMIPISQIRDVFEINLFAQMELTQLVLKIMMKQNSGSIVNFGSIAGIDLNEGNSAYGVSKAAVMAWTKTLAYECSKYNIRVNAVAPGLIDTDMAKQMESKAYAKMIESSLAKRLGTPEEVAKVVKFLVSDESSFVNAQVVRICGGGG